MKIKYQREEGSPAGRQGFTLIELLIVIAILGTLAVVVLLALNPIQQLARTRDSGRSSTVTQLGHALEAYATTRNGVYPSLATCPAATWITTCLVGSGEISIAPKAVPYSAGGASCGGQTGWCYSVNAANPPQAIIYAQAEARANISKCSGTATCPTSASASFVYSTADGRGGLVCSAAPTPGAQTFCD